MKIREKVFEPNDAVKAAMDTDDIYSRKLLYTQGNISLYIHRDLFIL